MTSVAHATSTTASISGGLYVHMGVRAGRPLPLSDVGQDVSLTIAAAHSSGAVLAVPEAAVFAGADGGTYVSVVSGSGALRKVAVRVGMSGSGLLQVTALRPGHAGRRGPGAHRPRLRGQRAGRRGAPGRHARAQGPASRSSRRSEAAGDGGGRR